MIMVIMYYYIIVVVIPFAAYNTFLILSLPEVYHDRLHKNERDGSFLLSDLAPDSSLYSLKASIQISTNSQ